MTVTIIHCHTGKKSVVSFNTSSTLLCVRYTSNDKAPKIAENLNSTFPTGVKIIAKVNAIITI